MEKPTTPKWQRALIVGRASCLLIGGVAVLETILHFTFRDRAPKERQWRDLKPRIAALYQPGDLVAVAPDWGEPMARRAFGDSIMPLSAVARGDDDTFARVIEIGILGKRRTEFASWPIVSHESLGKFELTLRKNPTWQRTRFDAIEHVDAASLSVAIERSNGEEACNFSDFAPMTAGNLGGDPTSPRVRFSCPGGGIHWVGVTIIDDEHYRPRRCIWAPPSTQGTIALRFHQVSFGAKLVGHAGAPWLMVRDGVGPPIALSAGASGTTLGSVAAKDTDGWIRFEWQTEHLKDKTSDLELKIAQTRGEQRFCFTLEAR